VRAAFLLLALLLPAAAVAQERVGVRVGDHPGHGRIVFDWPRETAYRVEEAEGRVTLRFGGPAEFDLSATRRGARNLRGVEANGDAVTLTLAPGARLRHFRLGTRVVVDLLNAEAAAPAPRPERRAAPAPAAARAAPAAPPAAVVAPPAAPPLAPAPVVPAVQVIAGGLLLPVPAETGAALLRRGATWLLVLDAPVALDPAPLREGAFADAQLATGQAATVLRIPAAALAEPVLTRVPEGWRLEAAPSPPTLRSIRAELDPGAPPRLLLRAARAADAVAVLDPETGGTLLVGTVREGGEATPLGRRTATFDILPTRLGAAILPRADSVTLRALPAGFAAAAGGAVLALGPESEQEAAGMSRLFDLPAEPFAALLTRERNAMLAMTAAPPLARGVPRLRAAEALLALGLGAEAQSLAALALRDDPRLAEDPRAHALHGAAALLAGRPAEADGLLHRRLAESDELVLWRGLLAAARGGDGAAGIAASLPILRAWPEPMRARLAPRAAEVLALAEPAAARRLLAGQEDDPAFALARAMLLEGGGEAGAALAAYDVVARGQDRRARAVAMRRAAELRLASGALDAAGGAAAMEAVVAAWRGDAQESSARLRLAELRAASGDPRGAFDVLRETEVLFPELAPTLRPRQAEALVAAIAAEPPVAAVALFDAHAALLPAGPVTETALGALADRLAALDLPDRARAVLAGALRRATDAESRARIGLRAASLAQAAGDAAGARAVLAETEGATLPDALRRDRALADARAAAALGLTDRAVAGYRAAGDLAAGELAEFLAARQDWRAAAAVLREHLPTLLPPAPAALDEAGRRLVARTAALLTLAGDEAGLAALRASEAGRMGGGNLEDAFMLLTAGRVAAPADLPRARQELDLARALPSRL